MSAESHARAMRFPIRCVGNCQQGRRLCDRPLTCSGMPADEAIAQFRTAPRAPVIHRKPLPRTFEPSFDIEGPQGNSDFLKQEGALHALALVFWFLLTGGCAIGFIASLVYIAGSLLRAHGFI